MTTEISVGPLRVVAVGCPQDAMAPPASIDEAGRVAWYTGAEVIVDGAAALRRPGVHELDLSAGRLLIRTGSGIHLYAESSEPVDIAVAGGRSPLGDVYAAFHDITLHDGDIAFTATLEDGRRTLVIRDRQVLTTGAAVGGGRLGGFLVSRLGFSVCVIAMIDNRPEVLHAQADLVAWSDTGLGVPLWQAPAISAETSIAAVTLAGGQGALVATAMGVGAAVIAEGDFGTPVASSAGNPFGVACTRDGELWLGVFRDRLPLEGACIAPLAVGDRTDTGEVVTAFRPLKFGPDGTLLLAALLDGGTPALLTLHDLFGWFPST